VTRKRSSQPERAYTLSEAAEMLSLGVSTVRKRISQRQIGSLVVTDGPGGRVKQRAITERQLREYEMKGKKQMEIREPEQAYGAEQLAGMLAISVRTVRTLMSTGEIRTIGIGEDIQGRPKRRVVTDHHLQEYLDKISRAA
jgi:hypothetical protein